MFAMRTSNSSASQAHDVKKLIKPDLKTVTEVSETSPDKSGIQSMFSNIIANFAPTPSEDKQEKPGHRLGKSLERIDERSFEYTQEFKESHRPKPNEFVDALRIDESKEIGFKKESRQTPAMTKQESSMEDPEFASNPKFIR